MDKKQAVCYNCKNKRQCTMFPVGTKTSFMISEWSLSKYLCTPCRATDMGCNNKSAQFMGRCKLPIPTNK